MDLLGDVRDTLLLPFRRRELDTHIERGTAWKVQELTEQHDFEPRYVEQQAKERFSDILPYTTKDQAEYARDMGLDRDWAREQAKEWVEQYIEEADRGDLTRDRVIGHHMRVFDIDEDEIEADAEITFHVYAPDKTASEELADAILTYRDQGAVRNYADLDAPRYAYADPQKVRERIETRAEDVDPDEFQTQIEEYEDGTATTDVYERLGMDWAGTEELEAYIDSFWEPDDEEPELMHVDLET